jgi:Gas vesicle protein
MAIDPQRSRAPMERRPSDSLADILERVLDKGIVIAGDIQINLLDIELLTIKLRLVIAGIDKAREIGINWWETDPMLNAESRRLVDENRQLRQRLDALERRLDLPPADRAERAMATRQEPAREGGDA